MSNTVQFMIVVDRGREFPVMTQYVSMSQLLNWNCDNHFEDWKIFIFVLSEYKGVSFLHKRIESVFDSNVRIWFLVKSETDIKLVQVKYSILSKHRNWYKWRAVKMRYASDVPVHPAVLVSLLTRDLLIVVYYCQRIAFLDLDNGFNPFDIQW